MPDLALIAAIALWLLVLVLYGWALCRAAALGDRMADAFYDPTDEEPWAND